MFEKRDLGVIVCSHVFNGERKILYATHEKNGWQFLCGDYDHDGPDGNVVGIGHLIDRDPTLNSISDLPVNWEAERSTNTDEWDRNEIED